MEFKDSFGGNSGAIWVTAILLLIFGYVYNRIVDWAHRKGFNDGLVWLEVVVGTAVTIGASGFTIGWANTLLLLGYFACSGFFMAAGDIWRYVQALRAENGYKE